MGKNRFSEGSGPSQRQLRVGELIRRTLSDVLARGDVHDPDLATMSITVGEVRCSPDLRIATAYVLPLGGGDRDLAIAALARNRPELRRAVSKELTLKYAPDLRFRIDETFDRIDATRELFARDEVRRDLRGDEDDGAGDDMAAEDVAAEDGIAEDRPAGDGPAVDRPAGDGPADDRP